jgi:hypothetical protein
MRLRCASHYNCKGAKGAFTSGTREIKLRRIPPPKKRPRQEDVDFDYVFGIPGAGRSSYVSFKEAGVIS